MALKAVVFDVGETLVDETRMWEEWADRLGVPHLTFLATLGGVIARGEDHRRVFELVRPNYDVDRALREGVGNGFRPADLYDDALPCIERLRAEGQDAFYGYQVPQAALALKQGFGRLIRTATDRGIVAVLDARMTRKGYGRIFVDTLPRCQVLRTPDAARAFWTKPEAR